MFRSVMSVLVRWLAAVRSFSSPSRPALRAAAYGGRPRPADSPPGVGFSGISIPLPIKVSDG
jgi:hypothetical protein